MVMMILREVLLKIITCHWYKDFNGLLINHFLSTSNKKNKKRMKNLSKSQKMMIMQEEI